MYSKDATVSAQPTMLAYGSDDGFFDFEELDTLDAEIVAASKELEAVEPSKDVKELDESYMKYFMPASLEGVIDVASYYWYGERPDLEEDDDSFWDCIEHEVELEALIDAGEDQAQDHEYLRLLFRLHGKDKALNLLVSANKYRCALGAPEVLKPWQPGAISTPDAFQALGEWATCGMLQWRGQDLQGRPVLYCRPHLCPAWRSVNPVEPESNTQEQLHLIFFEFGRHLMQACQSKQFVFVMDFSQVRLSMIRLSFAKMTLSLFTTAYVDRLADFFVGPTNYNLYTLYGVIKPIYLALCRTAGVDPGLEKVHLMADPMADLSAVLGETAVPDFFGGQNVTPAQIDWPDMVRASALKPIFDE